MKSIQEVRRNEMEKQILHFAPPALLPPNCKLALHLETRTLSLLCEGPELLKQQQLSESELRVITHILKAFPYYCPYEVLLASINTFAVNHASISEWRLKLYQARSQGTLRQELRPLRRALSSLRVKLRAVDLEISIVREEGCSLTRLRAATPLISSSQRYHH